jgi:catechol 2,3-dioxygenase-like lactoylglutathione lyase family enzyme
MSDYNVGGVLLERPFKIRRLGHFGVNLNRMSEGLHFYRDLLGFEIMDVREHASEGTAPLPDLLRTFGDLNGYFMRFAGDHHALVLYNHRLRMAMGRTTKPDVTINQITWQVGSLAEVAGAEAWFRERGLPVVRSGRDMPGSNWHVYLRDPEEHQNELFYGMEQIGWDGHAKPLTMHDREFGRLPALPQRSERAEIDEALAKGIDLLGGYRDATSLPETYDVQGILLGRPFKIVKHGPVNLFVHDLEKMEAWYRDVLGFALTEEVTYRGHRCVFLRNNTEHHSLALFPAALRKALDLRAGTTLMAFGLQLANYQQLRDAIAFLRAHGVTLRELPSELTPGMDHTVLAFDPDGHAIQLYWSMEQVGWDGKPRPAAERRAVVPGAWPEALPANSDSFTGEPLLGPWG